MYQLASFSVGWIKVTIIRSTPIPNRIKRVTEYYMHKNYRIVMCMDQSDDVLVS